MNQQQKRALQIALNFCRDRIQVNPKGSLDYEAIAPQIAALPDVKEIRSRVAWVMDYEAVEGLA